MGQGEGAWGVSVRQLFPISTQSTAASRSRPRRATAAECGSEECGGQKYLQLEGHPNLFGHIRADPLHPPGRLDPSCSGVMCKSVAKSSLFPTPSGSHYAFSSLFSIFSVPAPLRSAVTLCLRGVQLSWLGTPTPPTCNLRLAVLKSSHSSTGAYISTCSSPLQEQKFAQNGLFSFLTCTTFLHVQALLSTAPIFRISRHPPGNPSSLHCKALIYKCKPQTRGSCLWPGEITPLRWALWNGCKVCFVFSSALVSAQASHWWGDDKLLR